MLPRLLLSGRLVGLFLPGLVAAALPDELPLQPQEAEVIRAMVEREGNTEALELKAYDGGGYTAEQLHAMGVTDLEPESLGSFELFHPERSGYRLRVTYDADGHVVAMKGNGPWLQNETLRSFVALPELRIVRVDHNSVHHNAPDRGELFNASGFDALADSKIRAVRLTSGFNDAGLAEVVKLKNLEDLELFHVRVTEEGLELLREQPTIERLRVGLMGRAPASSLAAIATIPNLKALEFQEAYVTYEDGLAHLKPLAGQLQQLNLDMCLISDADLERVRADHPDLEITKMAPEAIVAGHRGVANRLAAHPDVPAELAEPLKQALQESESAN